jgi:hypothetical protein
LRLWGPWGAVPAPPVPGIDARKNRCTVLGVLFALHGTLTVTSLCSLPVFLLAHCVPRVRFEVWLVVYVCFTVCVHFPWMKVSLARN